MHTDVVVTVQPKSSQNKIAVEEVGVKVWVNAPPVDGEANEAVCRLVSKALRVAKSKIEIVRGISSREKTLRIEGLTEKEILERLKTP
ncbi:MAG: DUF167 domain-containing protein [Armatimonadetes bacterium]|nr:DUF167 domain-containing protein [Armatimonadota bacterium]MBS1701138.1 DUF167 domain-containing protein [Armatimonadota bacterium]MBS1725131.1 DUF167 domain-containing protein [Armatimonadota bacterium]